MKQDQHVTLFKKIGNNIVRCVASGDFKESILSDGWSLTQDEAEAIKPKRTRKPKA